MGSSTPEFGQKETQIIYPAGTNAVLWQADQKQQKIFQGSLEFSCFWGGRSGRKIASWLRQKGDPTPDHSLKLDGGRKRGRTLRPVIRYLSTNRIQAEEMLPKLFFAQVLKI